MGLIFFSTHIDIYLLVSIFEKNITYKLNIKINCSKFFAFYKSQSKSHRQTF